jgi:hypothetical protein
MTTEVKTPVEYFMDLWTKRAEYQNKIDVLLREAQEAIKAYHFNGRFIGLFNEIELTEHASGTYSVIFPVEYGHLDTEYNSYTIPLETCLAGRASVIAFFVEEKRQQQEKADAMGLERLAKEKDDRRRLYNKLKLEFDPPPEAIIKRE